MARRRPKADQLPTVPDSAQGEVRDLLDTLREDAYWALVEADTLARLLRQSHEEAMQKTGRYLRAYEEHGGQLKLNLEV